MHQNYSCLVISMGLFSMNSKLADRKIKDFDYTTYQNINKLYDCYDLSMSELEFFTMWDYTNPQSVFKSKTKLDFVKDISMVIKLANIIEPKNIYFENLVVEIDL